MAVVGTAPEADPAEATAIAEADAQDEKALDRIVGTDDADATAQPVPAQDAATALTDGRARDASGKFTKDTSHAEPESGEPSEAPTNDATPEYTNALKSLQRDKVPQGVLDSMEPEAVIAWGAARAEVHLDIDRITSKNAELERAITLVQGKSEATVETTTVDVLDEVVSEFDDFYGEEAGGLQRKFGEAIIKKMTDGLGDQREQLQTILGRMNAQEQVEARKALSDRYSLSEEQRWQAVTAYMDKDANKHTTAHDAVLSACRQLFADEPTPDQVDADHLARSNGQATTEHRATPLESAPTVDDLEDNLIDAIEDGDTEARDRIQREIRRRTAVPLMLTGKVGVKPR